MMRAAPPRIRCLVANSIDWNMSRRGSLDHSLALNEANLLDSFAALSLTSFSKAQELARIKRWEQRVKLNTNWCS